MEPAACQQQRPAVEPFGARQVRHDSLLIDEAYVVCNAYRRVLDLLDNADRSPIETDPALGM